MRKSGWILVLICFVSIGIYVCAGCSAEGGGVGCDATENLQEEYEWSMVYLRALALMNADLHAERNLEALTRLHEKLVDNKEITYTEEDFIIIDSLPNILVDSKIDALLRELKRDRKAIMTGERGVLPWIKVRDGWFDLER